MDIEILGRITRVNCPAGQERALQSAADELNNRLAQMKKRTQVNNAEQLLAIAALNAFYELDNSAKDIAKEAEKSQAVSIKLEEMTQALDEILDPSNENPIDAEEKSESIETELESSEDVDLNESDSNKSALIESNSNENELSEAESNQADPTETNFNDTSNSDESSSNESISNENNLNESSFNELKYDTVESDNDLLDNETQHTESEQEFKQTEQLQAKPNAGSETATASASAPVTAPQTSLPPAQVEYQAAQAQNRIK